MNSTDTSYNDLLPLREPTFFILLSLSSGEKHGYAILKTIEQLSQGKLKMSTGTLYEALARMVELEWIERVDTPATVPQDLANEVDQRSKTRKAYRISGLGLRVLRAELARMRALVNTASMHLGEETG
jgi:DNA-binding PadR family transcriptional regulator